MLELCSIASGSSGNCICVGTDDCHVLIDAGISGKKIENGLNEFDMTATDMLNYYDQRNNFIMVRFNGERIKLYDNNRLTIVDAALQAGFPNDELFPKRGTPINFTVNGVARLVRGEAGDGAVVTHERKASKHQHTA